jgi:hypothetical protein
MRPVWWLPLAPFALAQTPNPALPADPLSPIGAPVELAPALLPPPPPEAPPIARPLPDWRQGFEWVPAGPAGAEGLSAVAIASGQRDTWALAALDGTVWITEDAAEHWARVLGPLSSSSADEDVLREIEARIGEIGAESDPSGWVSEDDLEQMAEEAQQASQQIIDELQSELDAGPWFLEQQAVLAGDLDAARPRVWFTSDGRLVIGRADGLRVAEHTAQGWTPTSRWADPVTAFTELPDRTFLVGLPDGLLRGTRDLRDFEPITPLDGVRVTDLLLDGGLYATTERGVWWTADGVTWTPLPATTAAVYATLPARRTPEPVAPSLEVPVVLGTDATILRTARPATDAATPVAGGPMPATTAFARRVDGWLFAASSAGPWWSEDGGLSWRSFSFGEDGVRELRDVEVTDDTVLLASASGLWALRPKKDAAPLELPEWVSLGALVDASLGRPELTAHVGSRWAAALAPDVSLEYRWWQDVNDSWDADTWTTRDVDTSWVFGTRLTWRPGRQQSGTTYDVLDPGANLSVLVTDGQAYIDDGTSGLILASAVRRGATQYRDEIAEKIGQLWRERQRLVAEGIPTGAPVADRVRQALRIQEIEARLDALSGGAVSSWEPGTPSAAAPDKRRGG